MSVLILFTIIKEKEKATNMVAFMTIRSGWKYDRVLYNHEKQENSRVEITRLDFVPVNDKVEHLGVPNYFP